VFGRGSIAAHVYDIALLPDGNVVKGLLASMELKADEDFVFSRQASNISLDVPSARVLDEIDRDEQLTLIERKAAVDLLLNDIAKNGPHEKYFLSPHEVNFIKQCFLQSNRKVVKAYLGRDWPYPDLFPYKKKTSTAASEKEIVGAVKDKQQKLRLLQRYYTWRGESLSGKRLARLAQPENGWNIADKFGVSPSKEFSLIYFRLNWEAIERKQAGILFMIECSFSSAHSAPGISVNGRESVALSAGRNQIMIPFSAMNDFYCIDIGISSALQPGSVAQSDFKIHSVQYTAEES
jgi:hypothetical protein